MLAIASWPIIPVRHRAKRSGEGPRPCGANDMLSDENT
jgi:hypothetical protein